MKPETINKRKELLIKIERILEGPMVLLGFVWLVLLVIELIWGINKTLEYISLSIWGIFIVDFATTLRLGHVKILFLKKG